MKTFIFVARFSPPILDATDSWLSH